MAPMKYRTIKTPHRKGSITLQEAIDAARQVSLNATHAKKDAKVRVKGSSGNSDSTPVSQRGPRRSK